MVQPANIIGKGPKKRMYTKMETEVIVFARSRPLQICMELIGDFESWL